MEPIGPDKFTQAMYRKPDGTLVQEPNLKSVLTDKAADKWGLHTHTKVKMSTFFTTLLTANKVRHACMFVCECAWHGVYVMAMSNNHDVSAISYLRYVI